MQKSDIESQSPIEEKEHKGGKKPLISCDKYDEEERKSLFGEREES